MVLARADLASIDPQEVIGLLLASSTAGLLPGLRARRPAGHGRCPAAATRPGSTCATSPARSLPFHGTMLVATRPEPPAAVLVVVGDDDLTAGTIDGVLDSARWLS